MSVLVLDALGNAVLDLCREERMLPVEAAGSF